jgi:hypothetical protein
MLALCRYLTLLRHRHIDPLLGAGGSAGRFERFGARRLTVEWQFSGRELRLVANLGDRPALGSPAKTGQAIYRNHQIGEAAPPWFVAADLDPPPGS